MDQLIAKRLSRIEKELSLMKKRMADRDSIMTEDDYRALLAYRKEKAAGTLTPHEELKHALGV